jgi:hypothetical protein
MVGEIELGAIQEGRHLSNFKYACAGYSIYLDDKDNPPGKGEKHAELPICVGLEVFFLKHVISLKLCVTYQFTSKQYGLLVHAVWIVLDSW